ncbi:MAG: hypothetical protein IKR69_03225 [Bacteroidales bacterium]|nr:hypothetical protein [Bacteroidales bacterium]
MAAFEKELNKLESIHKHLEEILDESVDYKLTQEKVIEEIVGIKDDLRELKDVAGLFMPPSIVNKALKRIESANRLIARISREWDLPDPAAERAMMFPNGEEDD